MTTFKTGNPVPSAAAKDLYDNAENLDEAINGSAHTWRDRTGRLRTSITGALVRLDNTITQVQADAQAVLAGLGYLVPVPYAGGLEVDSTRFTVAIGGNTYAPVAERVPFVTGDAFDPDYWRLVQGLTGGDLAVPNGAGMIGYDYSVPYAAGTVGAAIKGITFERQSIVVLSSGQSNMPQDVDYEWDPEPNLFLWDFNSNYQPSDEVGERFVPAPSTSMGPSLVAANTIAKDNPSASVYVINIHRGGLGLINWSDVPTHYDFRQAIEGNVAAALALIGKDEVDYFVWGGCESDANAQSQTIQPDMENWLFSWLREHIWFNAHTPIYVFGMSPYAQSAPGNGDFLWKRYNNALRAAVSADSSSRAYVGLENFPIEYFDPTGTLPYIHRTPLGYFKSGEKLGVAIQRGIFEPCPRLDDSDGLYTPEASAPVQCSVDMGYAAFTRIGNNIRVTVFATVTALIAGDIGFDVTVPVKVTIFPNNVMGTATSSSGGAGVVIPIPFTQAVRVVMRAAIGLQTVVLDFMYRANASDALPNSPPGTT